MSVEMRRGAQHHVHNHADDLVLRRSPPPAAPPRAGAEQRVVACWCWATRWWQSDHQRTHLSETKPMGLECGVDVFLFFFPWCVGVGGVCGARGRSAAAPLGSSKGHADRTSHHSAKHTEREIPAMSSFSLNVA
jgi:hypothetical protein